MKLFAFLVALMLFAELGNSVPSRRLPNKLKDLFGGRRTAKRDEECPLVTCAGKGGACFRTQDPDVMVDDCYWPYFCEFSETGEHKCASYRKTGSECAQGGSGCKPPGECMDGKCIEAGIGSECYEAEECPGPLVCTDDKCAAGSYAKAGEACDDNRGPKCNHPDGYVCSDNDVCIKAHTKSKGDSCTDDIECPRASSCNHGTCDWPWLIKKKGDACYTMECLPGLVCNDTDTGDQGICHEPSAVPEGTKCTSNAECGDSGICQCNSHLGHLACSKRPVYTQKILDETIEMQKCMEEGGYSNKALFECSLEYVDLYKKIYPGALTCNMPGDSSRNAVSLIWFIFLALVVRLLQ